MNNKLKIGLMLDSFNVPAWEYSVIDWLAHTKYASIDLLVLNEGRSKIPKVKKLRELVYNLHLCIDNKLFHNMRDAFEEKNLSNLLGKKEIVRIRPIQEEQADIFPSDCIQTIRKRNLDVIIKMGFGVLSGEILKFAKYGVWSYSDNNSRAICSITPGYFEVVENQDVTCTSLLSFDDKNEMGRVISRSWSRTYNLSIIRNRDFISWKSAAMLSGKIRELSESGNKDFFISTDEINTKQDFCRSKSREVPSNLQALKFALLHFSRLLHRSYEKLMYFEYWFLMFKLSDDMSTSIGEFKKIMPSKDRFWADPFVVFHDKSYFIFFEELLYSTNKGYISVIEMDKKGNYKDAVKVLEKDYHLSYPFVFSYQDKYYMIPESSDNKTIELYECSDFPYSWKFKMNLMEGVKAVDTTLYFYNNKWWLFTGMEDRGPYSFNDDLYIFFADEPFSTQWKKHPLNPVLSDVRKARPAGRIFMHNNKIFRPSQDCSGLYGKAININEIVALNEWEYEERTVSSIKPGWDPGIIGTHTYAYINGLTVIDAFMRIH